MEYTAIVFYLLLIDALVANIIVWSGKRNWYQKNFKIFSRYFPLTKGWAGYYLVLVLFIGFILM